MPGYHLPLNNSVNVIKNDSIETARQCTNTSSFQGKERGGLVVSVDNGVVGDEVVVVVGGGVVVVDVVTGVVNIHTGSQHRMQVFCT